MAQHADQEEAMDCDAEFKTEGHPLIGREVIRSDSKGTVVGWLSAAEADFLDAAGKPAALYHIKYTEGELAGEEEDFELYEVEAALPKIIGRKAMPWKATDEHKKIIKELRDSELKKPDGARTSHQLAAKAVSLKLFRKAKQGAIQAWISKAELVSEENKDVRDVAGHAKKTLASLEAKDVTARAGDFIVANHGLDCRSGLGSNKHPGDAALGPVYVRIKNGGSAKDVEEATTEALHAGLAMLSYHEAHGRKQLEELERTNATRYAEVMKYRKKWDDQTILKVDDGWCASGIDGVTRQKTAPDKPDILIVCVAGPYFGHRREDTEQGRAEIQILVAKSDSERLRRRRELAEAAEAAANGTKSYEELVAAHGWSLTPVEEQSGSRAGAIRKRPRALPPPRPGPPRRPMARGELEILSRARCDSVLATMAAARRHELALAPSVTTSELWRNLFDACFERDRSICRPSLALQAELFGPIEDVLALFMEAHRIDAPRVCFAQPSAPSELPGLFREFKAASLAVFRRTELELSVDAAELTDACSLRPFLERFNRIAKEETTLFEDILSVRLGAPVRGRALEEAKTMFGFDLLLDYDEPDLAVPIPEGIVFWPTPFSARWRGRVFKNEWRGYVGAARVHAIAMVSGAASMVQRSLERAGVEAH